MIVVGEGKKNGLIMFSVILFFQLLNMVIIRVSWMNLLVLVCIVFFYFVVQVGLDVVVQVGEMVIQFDFGYVVWMFQIYIEIVYYVVGWVGGQYYYVVVQGDCFFQIVGDQDY